ncbi:unnamed protein product [Closterium sp. Naga37s-1]|nr:unnamed protein product [Closterium sp. Naga37s-1]
MGSEDWAELPVWKSIQVGMVKGEGGDLGDESVMGPSAPTATAARCVLGCTRASAQQHTTAPNPSLFPTSSTPRLLLLHDVYLTAHGARFNATHPLLLLHDVYLDAHGRVFNATHAFDYNACAQFDSSTFTYYGGGPTINSTVRRGKASQSIESAESAEYTQGNAKFVDRGRDGVSRKREALEEAAEEGGEEGGKEAAATAAAAEAFAVDGAATAPALWAAQQGTMAAPALAASAAQAAAPASATTCVLLSQLTLPCQEARLQQWAGQGRVVKYRQGSMRVGERRALFGRARLLVAAHGSVLPNMVFMPPDLPFPPTPLTIPRPNPSSTFSSAFPPGATVIKLCIASGTTVIELHISSKAGPSFHLLADVCGLNYHQPSHPLNSLSPSPPFSPHPSPSRSHSHRATRSERGRSDLPPSSRRVPPQLPPLPSRRLFQPLRAFPPAQPRHAKGAVAPTTGPAPNTQGSGGANKERMKGE